jgi:hypothetical protein
MRAVRTAVSTTPGIWRIAITGSTTISLTTGAAATGAAGGRSITASFVC